MKARAIIRGYVSGGKRAGQVRRVHIIREEGPRGWEPGKQTLCGQGAWGTRGSDPILFDPMPAQTPDGLSWCPKCIGHLAERAGMLDKVAAMLAGEAA